MCHWWMLGFHVRVARLLDQQPEDAGSGDRGWGKGGVSLLLLLLLLVSLLSLLLLLLAVCCCVVLYCVVLCVVM